MKLFSSYRTMIVLLALYALSMAAATFIEKAYGTTLARMAVYYSPLFILLQFLLAVNFVMIAIRHHLFKLKRWGLLCVHLSLIVILAGAMTTHLFGKEGVLHLREGEKSDRIAVQTNRGQSVLVLPFQVELVKFTLTRYPGSSSPSSFESVLLVHIDGSTRRERVYMNNVLDVKGYRFFQASYDTDEAGTILSVNQDVAGRIMTYSGYLLLLLGCIGCFVGKNGRIRTLFRQLNKRKIVFCIASFLAMTAGCCRHTPIDGRMPSPLAMTCMDSIANPQGEAIRFAASAFSPMVVTASAFAFTSVAQNPMTRAVQKSAVPAAHAERFGTLPVQSSNGRIIPMNTFSSEILRKLHQNTRFGDLNPDRFLLSLFVMPEMWMQVPLITCKNIAIADYFSLPQPACSYVDFFRDDGSYKLQGKLDEAYRKAPVERTPFDKELMKLDEKVNILHQLFECQLIRLFPKSDDPDGNWYAPGDDLSAYSGQDSMFVARIFYWYLSEIHDAMQSGDWSKPNEVLDMISTYQTKRNNLPEFDNKKITLELQYNKLDIFRWCKAGYLSLGGLLLFLMFIHVIARREAPKQSLIRRIVTLLCTGICIVFLFHMLGMGMRWKIGGYAPWSNSYETMIFMAWATVLGGLLFARRSLITFSLATLFAGIILFVSGLNWMDPQINPLVPVLKSPWLMFHVAILMAAYGFFGIGFLLGLLNLSLMVLSRNRKPDAYSDSISELSIINELALIIGLILMTIGTFMGAVWANESWGRYWGWDPKETWALITMIVYAMVTHLHLLRKYNNLWLFNLCAVIAFASVLMTYFGVNYFLSGMHSYGQ